MGKLILIVDDDENLIDYFRDTLNSFELDFEIITADGGDAGVQKVKDNIENLSVVFLDMIMPETSGIEAYEKIRALSSDIKIVLMSGYPLAELSNDINVFFLHKPFTAEDIEFVLEQVSR